MARPKSRRLVPKAVNPLHQIRVMGRLVRRAVKKPGTAPGTLVHSGEKKVERTLIRYIDYDADELHEAEVPDVSACLSMKDSPTVSWVDVDGLHDVELVQRLGEHFGWHPLMLEDIVSVGQRAKLEEYDGALYIVVPMLRWNADTLQADEEQLSLILGDRYVFTFQERVGDVFDGVRERLRTSRGRIRARGPDYLTYALIDAVVDNYFVVLEGIGELTEGLEEEVIVDPREHTIQRLHALKRELLSIRRAVWPLRDLVSSLVRDELERFTDETQVFLRDVRDHAVHVLDTVEALRDVVSGMMDLYLSTVSFRTNEIMKVLTVMASIFIPLTFLAGVYGMNFEHMPELHWPWAYPALLALMLVIGGGMVLYFRRKGWL
ncbi:MAG: magnesium/cobalt transporter CorA [Gemmatimonadetes bacterium]|nr:magnesium/cobalt transporter CorA [Gemmatimonadota bacterium]